jgi:hypothetical protein
MIEQELVTGLKGLEVDEGHLRVRARVCAGRREAAEKGFQWHQTLLNDTPGARHSFQAAKQAYARELANIAQQENIDQQTLQDVQALKATWQKELDALRNTPAAQGEEGSHEEN